MTTYICTHCHRAFYGSVRPENRKIRPFLHCPGCGGHRAHEASAMEDKIFRYVQKNAITHSA